MPVVFALSATPTARRCSGLLIYCDDADPLFKAASGVGSSTGHIDMRHDSKAWLYGSREPEARSPYGGISTYSEVAAAIWFLNERPRHLQGMRQLVGSCPKVQHLLLDVDRSSGFHLTSWVTAGMPYF